MLARDRSSSVARSAVASADIGQTARQASAQNTAPVTSQPMAATYFQPPSRPVTAPATRPARNARMSRATVRRPRTVLFMTDAAVWLGPAGWLDPAGWLHSPGLPGPVSWLMAPIPGVRPGRRQAARRAAPTGQGRRPRPARRPRAAGRGGGG